MTILVKAIILILLAAILFALGSALYFLIKGNGRDNSIVKALTWRIALSLLLFLLLLFAFTMGWITPHTLI